jgi:hypothetical protein
LANGLHHGVAEALLVVEHVVRNAELRGDAARVVNVLTGAAGALAVRRFAMVVELQGHAHHVVALPGQEAGDHRAVDAAGHRDDDARVFGALGQIKRVQHLSHPCGFKGQRTKCGLVECSPRPPMRFACPRAAL